MIRRLSTIIALLTCFVVPTVAHADLFSIYVSGKTGYVNGSGDAYDYFDSSMGSGAEAGLELLGIDIWADALKMGNDQFYFTANLGFDTSFGDKWKINLGFYTGPALFMRPEVKSEPFALSGTLRSALTTAGIDPTMVETEYNSAKSDEDELNRYALGWNLARTRIEFERELVPLVFIGLGAQASYHYMLTGADAASDAKHTIANDLEQRYGINQMDPNLSKDLRSELGAKELDVSSLSGFNCAFSAYLKIEI